MLEGGGNTSFVAVYVGMAQRSALDFLLLRYKSWSANPLCWRVKKALRRPAMFFCAFHGLSGLLPMLTGVLMAFLGPGAFPFRFLAYGWGLVALGVTVVLPVFYARWAFRRFFLEDEQLRLSAMLPEDFLAGLLLPAARVHVLGFLSYLGASVVGALFLSTSGVSTGGFSVLQVGGSLLVGPVTFASLLLYFTTAALRCLVREAAGAQSSYVAYPGPFWIAVVFLATKAGAFVLLQVLSIVGFILFTPVAGGGGFVAWWSGKLVALFLSELLLLIVLMVGFSRTWRKDYNLARTRAFGAPEYSSSA